MAIGRLGAAQSWSTRIKIRACTVVGLRGTKVRYAWWGRRYGAIWLWCALSFGVIDLVKFRGLEIVA